MSEAVGTKFTGPEVQRITNALNAMPYTGMLLGVPKPRDVESLVTWLDAFTEVLNGASQRSQEATERLRRLEADVEATRRVLGFDPEPST